MAQVSMQANEQEQCCNSVQARKHKRAVTSLVVISHIRKTIISNYNFRFY